MPPPDPFEARCLAVWDSQKQEGLGLLEAPTEQPHKKGGGSLIWLRRFYCFDPMPLSLIFN